MAVAVAALEMRCFSVAIEIAAVAARSVAVLPPPRQCQGCIGNDFAVAWRSNALADSSPCSVAAVPSAGKQRSLAPIHALIVGTLHLLLYHNSDPLCWHAREGDPSYSRYSCSQTQYGTASSRDPPVPFGRAKEI